MRDGQRVSYVGLDRDGFVMGDRGQILTGDDNASHVMWSTGSKTGQVLLMDNADITPAGTRTTAASAEPDGLDDSLEVGIGTLGVTAARDWFDFDGEVGVLNAMAERGHLASFGAIAQEARDLVAGRIRNDPSVRAVIAQLDDEEGEAVVSLATVALLRDAFGSEE